MNQKPKLDFSNSMLKNPINYVKPLVINLYYKKEVPPVGTYDL